MNYYEILGVEKHSQLEEIKKKYRKLAREFHPDLNKGSKEAEGRFKEIAEAYEVLSDSKKRSNYDMTLKMESKGRHGFKFVSPRSDFKHPFDDFFNPNEIFEQMKEAHERSTLLNVQLDITLEESFFGCVKDFSYLRVNKCSTCDGRKAIDPTDIVKCTSCNGTGRISSGNIVYSITEPCAVCMGSGTRVRVPCKACEGIGFTKGKVDSFIQVPKGILPGAGIRKKEGGNQKLDGKYSDCIIKIRIVPHNIFRIGVNGTVHINVPIPIHKIIVGGKIKIPTLHGVSECAIPNGMMKTVMTGKGFPLPGTKEYGDQIVNFSFEFPEKLPEETREALNKIPLSEEMYPGYYRFMKGFKS